MATIVGIHIPGTKRHPRFGAHRPKFAGELDEVSPSAAYLASQSKRQGGGGGHGGRPYGTRHPRGIHMHGDESDAMPDNAPDAGDIADNSTYEPNYGAGDTGSNFETSLDATGGMDPFANVEQPGDPGVDMSPVFDDGDLALLNTISDPYDVTMRVATLRNPRLDFGIDGTFYESVQGPAPIIGGEGMGFGNDGRLKK